MVKRGFLTKILLKWIPTNEQSVYEKRLSNVMKSLKVQHYNFNWDRTSCYVEFHFNENFYRLEHSVDQAKNSGIILENGLKCLMELTRSLEDLSCIINRGMNDFETWISGMKQSPSETKMNGIQEEFEIRYKALKRQHSAEYNTEELTPFGNEPSLNLNKIRLTNEQL